MSVTLKVWTDADKTNFEEFNHPDLDSALLTLNTYDTNLSLEERVYWPYGFIVISESGEVLLDIDYSVE